MKSNMANADPRWRWFEKRIQRIFSRAKGAKVHKDHVMQGRHSGRDRKLELFIEYPLQVPFGEGFSAKVTLSIAVDCKHYEKKVGIKKVEEFHGQVNDIGAHLGILVSTSGFDAGAKARAEGYGNIHLMHTPYDLLALARKFEIPDFHFCRDCKEARKEHFTLGGRVDFRYEPDENGVVWGTCDYCYAIHALCPDCGEITGFCDGDFNEGIECEGGCGRVYVATKYSGRGSRTVGDVERKILDELRDAGGVVAMKDANALNLGTKWEYATGDERPLDLLMKKGLAKVQGRKVLWTNEGRELAEKYLKQPRSGHYGW